MERLIRLIFLILILTVSVFAATTGKIRGVVTDAQTGDPIAGVNVFLTGKPLGGATNADGVYIILRVPPGQYEVQANMLGYNSITKQNVKVESDRTITLDFELQESILEGEGVVIVAERDLVKLDVSASETNIQQAEMKEVPFANRVENIIAMQAGVTGNLEEGELKIREGGASEVNVLIDGFSTVDAKFAKVTFPVNKGSIEEVKILRGGYNAEYGEARSGIVNIVTKDPGEKLQISLDYQLEPAGLRHAGPNRYNSSGYWLDDLYDGPDSDEESNIVRYEGITPDTKKWEGWNAYSDRLLNDSNPNNDLTAEEARELWRWRHRPIEYGKLAGHNIDLAVSGGIKLLPWDMSVLSGFKYENRPFTYPQALDNYEETGYSLKIVNKFNENNHLTLFALHNIVNTVSRDRAGSNWSNEVKLAYNGGDSEYFYPYRKPFVDNKTTLLGMKILNVMTPSRYFEADISYFRTSWDTGKFPNSPENRGRTFHGRLYYDPQAGYVPVELGVNDDVSGYRMYGGASSEDYSYSDRYNARISMVDQFHPSHELKTGFEFKFSHLVEDRLHLHDDDPAKKFLWEYDVSPIELSAYIQDKVEFWGMIANVGVRWDYYSANKKLPDVYRTLEFPTNKAIFDSMRAGTVPLRKPSAKQYVSPRVGISFPITTNSKVYFNYGHFVQMPATEGLYSTTADFGRFWAWPSRFERRYRRQSDGGKGNRCGYC